MKHMDFFVYCIIIKTGIHNPLIRITRDNSPVFANIKHEVNDLSAMDRGHKLLVNIVLFASKHRRTGAQNPN